MFSLSDRGARTLKCLLLAFAVLLAQQGAQLHALGHVREELAHPQKSKAPVHRIKECCIAFHAVGTALTAFIVPPEPASAQIERTPWSRSEARARSSYRLLARAPPLAV